MKMWILAMAMMMGVTMSAQEHHRKHDGGHRPHKEHREMLSPEQRAELKAKKLTLALDLTDKQQADLKKVFAAQAKERQTAMEQRKANHKAGEKITPDERFALQTKRLDAQIANKREIKKILTAEQFAKFEKMKHKRGEKFANKSKKMKRERRR